MLVSLAIISIVPFSRSLTILFESDSILNTTSWMYAFSPQYSSNLVTTKFSIGELDTYLYGPVPIGLVSGFSLAAGIIATVSCVRKSESASLRTTST